MPHYKLNLEQRSSIRLIAAPNPTTAAPSSADMQPTTLSTSNYPKLYYASSVTNHTKGQETKNMISLLNNLLQNFTSDKSDLKSAFISI